MKLFWTLDFFKRPARCPGLRPRGAGRTNQVRSMKPYDKLSPDEIRSVEGQDVVDPQGEKVGVVEASWLDPSTGQAEFFGVGVGHLIRKCHLVLARDAQFDPEKEQVRLPHSKEVIGGAPTFPAGQELAELEKQEVTSYYNRFTPVRRATDIADVRPEEAIRPKGASAPETRRAETSFVPSEHTAVEQSLPAADLAAERSATAPESAQNSETDDQQITQKSQGSPLGGPGRP
jgi:hypothetical protein